MKITSAKFLRGVTGTDELLEDGKPQVALIGRSNVGKSTVINSLTGQKDLARVSDKPGFTQQINIYAINNKFYLLDLPGYGYASASWAVKDQLQKLIYWYLFDSAYEQKKVALIVDANVGPTKDDLQVLASLKEKQKNIVIVANKIDKIKKSEYEAKMEKLKVLIGDEKILPYSALKKIGVDELLTELFIR